MSEEKRFIPIRMAFFKGFAGMVLSVLLFYLTMEISIIGILANSNDPILDMMKILNDFSELCIFYVPFYYWIIHPIVGLILYYEEFDISKW